MSGGSALLFRVLGRVAVWDGGTALELGTPKDRAVLSVLLANAGLAGRRRAWSIRSGVTGHLRGEMLREGPSGPGKTAIAAPAPAAGGGHGGGGLLSTDSGIRLAAMVAVMIGAPIGKSLGRAGARAARKTRRRYRRHRATELNRVKNYESGLFYAMHNFTERLKTFDENHRDSLLS